MENFNYNNVSTATLEVSIFHKVGAEYLANLKTNLERIGYSFELPNAIKSKFFGIYISFFAEIKFTRFLKLASPLKKKLTFASF